MSTHDNVTAPIAEYYAGKLAEHGPTHWGVDWNSDDSQHLRFEQLMRVADDAGGEFSLLDYGCGYGAMRTWLVELGTEHSFVGFDVAEDMVTEARRLCGEGTTCSFTADESSLEVADYTVASGVFNVRLDAADEDWEAHVLATLRRMAKLSRKGMSFNMLTSWSDEHLMRDYLYYGNPARLFDLCKREFSRHVALLHDYGLWEFTIIVRFDEEHGT